MFIQICWIDIHHCNDGDLSSIDDSGDLYHGLERHLFLVWGQAEPFFGPDHRTVAGRTPHGALHPVLRGSLLRQQKVHMPQVHFGRLLASGRRRLHCRWRRVQLANSGHRGRHQRPEEPAELMRQHDCSYFRVGLRHVGQTQPVQSNCFRLCDPLQNLSLGQRDPRRGSLPNQHCSHLQGSQYWRKHWDLGRWLLEVVRNNFQVQQLLLGSELRQTDWRNEGLGRIQGCQCLVQHVDSAYVGVQRSGGGSRPMSIENRRHWILGLLQCHSRQVCRETQVDGLLFDCFRHHQRRRRPELLLVREIQQFRRVWWTFKLRLWI